MTKIIFDYNGKSKEVPINSIDGVESIAKIYKSLGFDPGKPNNRLLGYTLPNGQKHSFLSNKNHKFAVCCTTEDTKLGFCYTDDYAKAVTTAANWSNKYSYAEQQKNGKKFVVVDIVEVTR